MSIQVLVKFKVQDVHADTFVAVMAGAKAEILSAPGCQGIEVLQGIDSPSTVVLVETWESKEIHDQYAAKMAEAGSMDKLAPLLVAEPQIEFYQIK